MKIRTDFNPCGQPAKVLHPCVAIAAALAAMVILGAAGPGMAQVAGRPGGDPITDPTAWGSAGRAFTKVQEFQTLTDVVHFFADVGTALVIALSVAFHPVRVAARRTASDMRAPGLLIAYAMTGVLIGFLVEEHGYLVGFVVFGVGTLLRFRTDVGRADSVVELILVTVLGLCVGLDLRITAILVAAVVWVLIWLAGRNRAYDLALKAADRAELAPVTETLDAEIRRMGGKIVFAHTHAAKPSADLLVSLPARVPQQQFEDSLTTHATARNVSWKLSQ